jgi:hypothetical protein
MKIAKCKIIKSQGAGKRKKGAGSRKQKKNIIAN